jgi:hypothetical protein
VENSAKPDDRNDEPRCPAPIGASAVGNYSSAGGFTHRRNQLKGLRPSYVRACQFLAAPALLYYAVVQFSADNLATAASCVGAGLLATQAHRIGLTAQEARLAQEMSATDDIHAAGPLAEVLDWPDKSLRAAASVALCRLLPRLKPGDNGMLNQGQWECLHRMLRPDVVAGEPALVNAILLGVAQAGDSSAIPHVRRVAEMPTKTVLATEVKTLAAECLQTLMGRSSHETLLRPAGLNPATADVLLRPAGADSTSQPGVLLRAHSGEGDTAGPPAAASGSEE